LLNNIDRFPDIAEFVINRLDARATGIFQTISMARCRTEQMLTGRPHLIAPFQ
jgi:hypothetical protein